MNKSLLTISDWKFRRKNHSQWFNATVPGTVHTDLYENGLIPHPFEETNEKDLQWIDKQDWEYHSKIKIDANILTHDYIELVFDGLDTFADIYINEQFVLHTDNMFRQWKVNIKPYIHEGINELYLLFSSPINKGIEQMEEVGYILPAPNDDSEMGEVGDLELSPYTRKAPYHYGWDWGPRFVTSGIWKEVRVEYWTDVTIDDLFIQQLSITKEKAVLLAQITVRSNQAQMIQSQLSAENVSINLPFQLKKGLNHLEIPLEIPSPRLWWTKQLGAQNFYNFTFDLFDEINEKKSLTVRTGLRSIKLIQNNDEFGTSFLFELNGIPTFIKGANHIPNDTFLPEIDKERYKKIIETAVAANMNMLRVWGGGIYESDIFYELCDENGLLVWQDFIFSCSMYPGTEEFLESIIREAEDNLIRLRNHPSLAIWCGNNEIDSMWKEYNPIGSRGWQKLYDLETKEKVWTAYDRIFHQLLPKTVDKLMPGMNYWPSSPMAELSYDHKQHASLKSGKGDIHFWNVWHSLKPIEDYNDYVGRFMSEYGFQSFPDIETLDKITTERPLTLDSSVVALHQKNKSGNEILLKYLESYYGAPKNFESFIYLSQSLQAYAFETAILAHRRKKPFCMGTLYWQLNDSWPGASWSSIDYYGNWKAAHYRVKEAYKNTVLAYHETEKELHIYGISDEQNDFSANLTVYIFNFKGNLVNKFQNPVELQANSSSNLCQIKKKEWLPTSIETQEFYIYAEIVDSGKNNVDSSAYYFKNFHQNLKNPNVSYEIEIKENHVVYIFSTNLLAKNVKLSLDLAGEFSENYFDLHPGIIKKVQFIPKEFSKESKWRSLSIHSMIDYL